MLKAIAFNDEITLYWDRAQSFVKGDKYKVEVNGEVYYAQKTHYELYNLESQKLFKAKVTLIDSDGKEKEFIGEGEYLTLKNKNKIDVTKAPYYAVGDGITNNRQALQKAFDDCTEEDYIYIPKGVFVTGGLKLHSNSELYVEKGAVLQGTADHKDYLPKILSRFEGAELYCYQSLINMGELDRNGGYSCKNVIIRGGGQIKGGGGELRKDIIDTELVLQKDYMESLGEKLKECETPVTIPGRARGRLINMSNCQNIVLSNIEFFNSPSWNIHFIYSDNIVTNRCSITSKGISNGDGWNPDSSTNCTVFDTVFNTGDDCIAIKSGKNPEGNIVNKPTKNVKIFDIKVLCGHSVAIGSEMSGGVDGVYVWDSDIVKIEEGIRVKVTKKRGGYVKNLFVYDCDLCSAVITSRYSCNDDGEGANQMPYLENFHFENATFTGVSEYASGRCENVPCLSFIGMDSDDHHVKNVTVKNCVFKRDKDNQPAKLRFERVDNLVIDNAIFE